MLFSGIARIRLMEEMTPLERLNNVSSKLNHSGIWIKRDDMMSIGLGGNKIRSLEFWLGEAVQQGADTIRPPICAD